MKYMDIKKEDIEPSGWNPRSEYDEDAFDTLKKSIEGMGLVEPIIVRPNPKKKGKFSIIAGEGRWKGSKKGDKLPCVVRDDNELDAKIVSLIENYIRTKVDDVDHEKFIADIYQQGLNKKWKNYVDMHRITGIPENKISYAVTAHQDRNKLKLKSSDQRIVSTTDMMESRPLKDKPELRKKLLEKRARGDVKASGHIMHEMSTTLSKVPESVAQAVLNNKIEYDDVKTRVDMLGGKQMPIEVAEDLVDKLADEKTKISIGKKLSAELDTISMKEGVPTERKVVRNVDVTRLEVWEKRWRQFEMMTIHDVNVITSQKYRDNAVEYLKKIRDKCSALLVQLGKEKVINVNKKK
jgi:ParB/RepB/Spo0J family partition protein